MATLWPWLVVAGLGVVHGLNPANGWMFAAACGLRTGDAGQARRALLPIATGHAASVTLMACVTALGMSMNRSLIQNLCGALLVGAASYRLLRGAAKCSPVGTRTGHTGIALWSFVMATAHGAGLMLVPALVPLCIADNPAREITATGSLALGLAVVGLHTAAMLVTTGVIATGVCRGVALHPRLLDGTALHRASAAALVVAGVLLMTHR